MEMNGGWIIVLDIRKYFDSIKWTYLCDILKQRVRDGVLIRLLGKWLQEVAFPRLQGKAFEVRFADDALLCFENKADALRYG